LAGQFDGRVALVTGGGSGIGRATALAFAREGAQVVVADVDTYGGEETARRIHESETGCKDALFLPVDISEATQVETMIVRTVEAFGRLDYAFNNAGVEGSGLFTHEYPESEWRRIISTNLIGTWLCMKYEIARMVQQGSGAIVNTASIAGLVASPSSGSAYTASKHGVVGLTRTAAVEYAQAGIRVNAVCPGAIATPMVDRTIARRPEMRERLVRAEPVGRLGTPEEVAASVVWLCSDQASFVTGVPMPVDGGYVAQ
jgi:NAD(P)-dependent dehydrogenase (short-subunit alcohol dehydrogenase family)